MPSRSRPFEATPTGAGPPMVLGVDEAGRGSVIGPLVVGGFLVREDRLKDLVRLGVRDSKLLSPARREELFGSLAEVGSRLSVSLSPREIDAHVGRGDGGLNRLEAEAFARIVRRARPGWAYLDACDPVAERFGRRVAALAGTAGIVVSRHHADRDLPVVGAASIVAKVLRDRAIRRLRARLGDGVGSGYPGDRRTRAFVAEHLARGASPTPWLRRSWATTESLMPKSPRPTLERYA